MLLGTEVVDVLEAVTVPDAHAANAGGQLDVAGLRRDQRHGTLTSKPGPFGPPSPATPGMPGMFAICLLKPSIVSTPRSPPPSLPPTHTRSRARIAMAAALALKHACT
jgi:hypothetical protein